MVPRHALSALAFAALAATLPAPAGAAPESPDLRRWIDGPVRYIAVKEEVRAFRALETDDARALFVERFWARRDPSPDTLANEYRQLFWQRVSEANTNFVDSTKPGWMTDRGKIHILYGPPTEVQSDTSLKTGVSATAGAGYIRWIYEGRPAERMDMNPIVVVAFVRDTTGEYRLSYDPRMTSVFFSKDTFSDPDLRAIQRFETLLGTPSRSQLSVMLDLGRMQEVPPQERVLLETVETAESYQTIPLGVRTDAFAQADRTDLAVAVSIDLRGIAPGDRPAILARFVPLARPGEDRLLGEDSFRVLESEGYRAAQGRIALAPGDYTLTVAVADPVAVKTGIHRSVLHLREPARTLRLGEPIWAEWIEPLPYAALASYDEPFHVGPYRVMPRFSDSFRRGETLRLFFEAEGAGLPVEVSYQLEGREDDGRWTPLGAAASAERASVGQAWELPTAPAWPLGDYRIRVEVRDAGDQIAAREVPFRLEAEEPSP